MANLVTLVDKVTGNFETKFNYSINASFNGIEGQINSAKFTFFVPNMINIDLSKITSIDVLEEDISGGKNVTLDFGQIDDLGVSYRFEFSAWFSLGTPSSSEYSFACNMIVNDQQILQDIADTIKLLVEPDFKLSREIILPKVAPALGSEVFFKVTMQNFGDLGANAQNILIDIPEVSFLTLDNAFEISGKDVSTSSFSDTSADAILGVIQDNSLSFQIPSYSGEKYEFIYKSKIPENAGNIFDTICNFYINDTLLSQETIEIVLEDEIFTASNWIYAPTYTLQGEYICFELGATNTGNQPLGQTSLECDLSQDITYYNFKTGVFSYDEIDLLLDEQYTITYNTANGNLGTLGPYNASSNTTVDLTSIISGNDNLSKLTWNFSNFYVGLKTKTSPHINGIVNSSALLDGNISNSFSVNWTDVEEKSVLKASTTQISDTCVLIPRFSRISSGTSVKPNDTLRYKIGANCRQSRLKDPIIAFILPKELEYVGNITTNYSDYFGNQLEVSTPEPILIKNINQNGDSILKFEFKNEFSYNFRQKAVINIEFDTKVKVGAIGSINCAIILNTLTSSGFIRSNTAKFEDIYNISYAQGSYALSNYLKNQILFIAILQTDKKVKSILDNAFVEEPEISKTIAGTEVTYKLTISNIGNATFNHIEIVDILPHIDDTGVILEKSARNSQFSLYSISEVTPYVAFRPTLEFDISYSQSYDPVRFGSNFNVIGSVDDWSLKVPKDLTTIKSFKVTSKNITLNPGEKLVVLVKMLVPIGVPEGFIAWNSFACDVSYKDLSLKTIRLLATEPEKVGVEVFENPADKCSISGYAFFDQTSDGTSENVYVNDVGAVLYNAQKEAVAVTFTAQDFYGNDGFYSFPNLDFGEYFIKFFIDDSKYCFTKKGKSKANPKTGITDIISCFENIDYINIGVINRPTSKLDDVLMVNNSSRKMVRNAIYNQVLLVSKCEDTIDLSKLY